ncbi:hypothetical protein MTP99_010363 [Tenebrio molitor]|nr:hypothetical protein MTP99_010363 [Tenebrio molitor]
MPSGRWSSSLSKRSSSVRCDSTRKGVLVQGGQSVDPQITEGADCSCVTDAAPSCIETASCGRIWVAGSTQRFCCQHDKLLVSGLHLQGPCKHSQPSFVPVSRSSTLRGLNYRE